MLFLSNRSGEKNWLVTLFSVFFLFSVSYVGDSYAMPPKRATKSATSSIRTVTKTPAEIESTSRLVRRMMSRTSTVTESTRGGVTGQATQEFDEDEEEYDVSDVRSEAADSGFDGGQQTRVTTGNLRATGTVTNAATAETKSQLSLQGGVDVDWSPVGHSVRSEGNRIINRLNQIEKDRPLPTVSSGADPEDLRAAAMEGARRGASSAQVKPAHDPKLANDVAELKGDVRGLKTDIAGLKVIMDRLNSSAQVKPAHDPKLANDVAELKGDVRGLKTDIAGLKVIMDRLNTTVSSSSSSRSTSIEESIKILMMGYEFVPKGYKDVSKTSEIIPSSI